MLNKFNADDIPRIEGNQLKVLIGNFDEVVRSIYSKDDDRDKAQTYQMLAGLYQTAERATNDDMLHLAYGLWKPSVIRSIRSDGDETAGIFGRT